MNYQVYLKKRGRWRQLLRYVEQAGVPYVLEVEWLDTSKSPITAALEFRETPPEALVLPSVGEEEFEWYVMFADSLDVRRLVLPPPSTLQAVAAIYDKAVEYGIEVNWIYGAPPMTRPVDVEQLARSIRPTAARIVYDPVKAKGTKEIYRTIVTLSGYIREIYLSNRRGERGPRLPPFDPIGRINFVEILQALYLIQWEGRITIRQAAQFFNELDLQLRIGSEVLETTRSVGVSKKVQRRVAEIFNELMQMQ